MSILTRTPLFSRNQAGGMFSIEDTSLSTGMRFYVHSGTGTDGAGYGQNPDAPCATLDYAIGLSETLSGASKGDIIYVMPGSGEAWTTTGTKVTVDIAGLRIIGLGSGSSRPTFTFGHTGTTWSITANGVRLSNLLFVTNVDLLTTFATISGDDCTVEDCEFRDTTDKEVISDLTVTGDRFTFKNNLKNGYTGGDANARVLSLNGVDRALIEGNRFVTKVTTGIVNFVTTASTGVVIRNNTFYVNGTTDYTKNVVATIGGNTYSVDGSNFDLAAGSSFSGGSGSALAGDDISTLSAVVYGASGLASYGAGVAAGDGVSIAEVLRFTQEGVRKGSGTAIAADKGIVDALGTDGATVTDVATSVLGAIGADNNNNAFASTNVAANADGSVLERLEFVQANIPSLPGLVFRGATDGGMVASTTAIVCAGLAGYGDDYFNTKYYMQVIHNVNSDGNAPEPEVRQISDYVSATGTFTTVAFSANVEATDGIQVLHECLVTVGRDDNNNTIATTNVAANEDGSILERLEQLQEAVNVGTGSALPANTSLADFVGKGTGTVLAANKSLCNALGTDGTTVTDGAVSVLGAIGADSADNVFASTLVAANEDGSVLERLEQVQEAVNKGTGTALGANRSIVDEIRGAALNYNGVNYLAVTADFGNIGWNTVATHEVFTVTGAVRMRILAECTGTLTDAADLATLSLGIEGSAASWIAATDAAGKNGTTISIGEIWFDVTPTETNGNFSSVVFDKVVIGGLDVGVEVAGEALTGGSIVFHCWWEGLNATGAVAAGAGGAL